jgi:hypothetical protein
MCKIGWGALHRGHHAFDDVTTAIAGCFQPPAAGCSPTSRLINEKPTDEPCARPGGSTEPGIPADGSKNGANPGTSGGAGQRALLGWSHIGASSDRQSDGREQQ